MLAPATWQNPIQKDDTAYQSWQAAGRRAIMKYDPEARTAAPTPTFGSMVHNSAGPTESMNYAPGKSASADGSPKPDIAYDGGKDDEFEFGDVVDIVNPLQHLPVIGTIYRNMTGDKMKGFADIIGGAIFGGPIGAVASTVNVIVKDRTGKDIAENAMSIMGFGGSQHEAPKPDITYASNTPAPSPNSDVEELHAASFTSAAKAYNAYGQKNFAATKHALQTWNV